MKINNFTERNNTEKLYNRLEDIGDTIRLLYYKDFLTEQEKEELENHLSTIEYRVNKAINTFDKQQLKNRL